MLDVKEIRRKNLESLSFSYRTKTEFSEKLNKSPQLIGNILNGNKNMGSRLARDIESSLGLPRNTLDYEQNTIKTFSENDTTPPPGVVAIKKYKFSLCANPMPGSEPDWEEVHDTDDYWYRESFFRKRGISPLNCRIAEVVGDSMEPYLQQGDNVLWVETKNEKIVDGQIYVISINGNMKIKRMSNTKDGIIVMSDNPKYPSETYLGQEIDSIVIYGKVIQISRSE